MCGARPGRRALWCGVEVLGVPANSTGVRLQTCTGSLGADAQVHAGRRTPVSTRCSAVPGRVSVVAGHLGPGIKVRCLGTGLAAVHAGDH